MEEFNAFASIPITKFKNVDGKKVSNIGEYIINYLKKNEGEDIRIYVGTDSQPSSCVYVTVIVLYKEGKGGHLLYYKEKLDTRKANTDRLFKELQMSYQIAEYLEVALDGMYQRIDPNKKLVDIDIDFNPEPGDDGRNVSNQVYKSGVGWMEGCGYRVRAKPFAIAASCVADHFANKGNNRKLSRKKKYEHI